MEQQSNNNGASVRLVDAKEMAQILNVPVSWVYEQARNGGIRSRRFGKYVRFDVQEVLATSDQKAG